MHLTCTVSPRVCFSTGCGEINELLGDDQQPDDPDLALLHQGGAHPSTRAVLDPRHEGELGRVVSFHRAGLALVPPRSNIAPTCARLVPLRRGTPICVLSTRRTRPTRATTENADYEVRIVGTVRQTCRDIEENVHIAISLVLWFPWDILRSQNLRSRKKVSFIPVSVAEKDFAAQNRAWHRRVPP